jgi:hypothetical protein
MNAVINATRKLKFEFEFDVSCVKRYTETHTFTHEDVMEWVQDQTYTDEEIGYDIDWSDLTEEEQQTFIDYFAHNYCPADQKQCEDKGTTHDYDGANGYDEEYGYDDADGLPTSVYDEMEDVWSSFWQFENGTAIKNRINNHILTFQNSDGLEKKMTYKEYLDHKDYDGDDKVWLQLMGSFMGVGDYAQIWIKKAEVETEPTINFQSKFEEALKQMEVLKARVAELEATVEKKNKMIKALADME